MISIAIITFNHEKYIRKALDSVLSQKELVDEIEIVVGDDGSSDKTVSILEEYGRKYPFMKILKHDNWGISKNVYEVFKKCKGEFVAVLEGDDYWIDDHKLSKQLKILKKHSFIATSSNCLIVDKDNNPLGMTLHDKWKDFVITKKEIERFQTDLFLPSTLMFRNIFLSSGDDYSIIRDASKFGGSHSGMINLLGFLGNIFYSSECLSAWRKVTSGGSNFSSRKIKNLDFEHDQLTKYFVYKKAFGMNYQKYIKKNYYRCIDTLNNEMVNNVGKINALRAVFYSFIRSIKTIIGRKK